MMKADGAPVGGESGDGGVAGNCTEAWSEWEKATGEVHEAMRELKRLLAGCCRAMGEVVATRVLLEVAGRKLCMEREGEERRLTAILVEMMSGAVSTVEDLESVEYWRCEVSRGLRQFDGVGGKLSGRTRIGFLDGKDSASGDGGLRADRGGERGSLKDWAGGDTKDRDAEYPDVEAPEVSEVEDPEEKNPDGEDQDAEDQEEGSPDPAKKAGDTAASDPAVDNDGMKRGMEERSGSRSRNMMEGLLKGRRQVGEAIEPPSADSKDSVDQRFLRGRGRV